MKTRQSKYAVLNATQQVLRQHMFTGFVFLLAVLTCSFMVVGCGGSNSSALMGTGTGPGTGTGTGGTGPGTGGTPPSCPVITLAEAAPQPFPPAPPMPAPTPGSNSSGSVCVSTPANGASVTSPMTMTAAANLTQAPIRYMQVYIDGNADYFTFYNQFTGLFWMPTGGHTIEVIATDSNGNNLRQRHWFRLADN